MAKPWSEVESSDSYKSLPKEKQAEAKNLYWNSVVITKPEFNKLSADKQDLAMKQFFGSSPEPQVKESPGLVSQAIQNFTSPQTRPLQFSPISSLGVPGQLVSAGLSAAGFPEEKAYSTIGQMGGGMMGGFGGAVGGSALGSSAEQFAKFQRGQQVKPMNVLKDAGVTAVIEGLTRGTGKFIFRRQIANEAKTALGKQLGAMKEAFSKNTAISVPSEQIYMPLKEAVEKVAVPHGKQAAIINRWLKYMEKNPNLSARNLIELEDDLGKVAQYGEFQKGVLVNPEVKKTALNNIARETRANVSKLVDDLAEKNNIKGFATVSKKLSKYLSDPHKWDVTHSTGTFGQRLIGASMAGVATGNPLAVGATYLGLQGIQSPTVRNAAYNLSKNKFLEFMGRAGKAGVSQLSRQAIAS